MLVVGSAWPGLMLPAGWPRAALAKRHRPAVWLPVTRPCLPRWCPCPDILERCLCAGYVVDSVAGPLADGAEGGTALHLAAAQGCEEVRGGPQLEGRRAEGWRVWLACTQRLPMPCDVACPYPLHTGVS